MITKVFCDVRGTFTGGKRPDDVERFVQLLNNLDDSEQILFSFVTSDNMEYLLPFLKELILHIPNTKISLGIQYAEDVQLENGELKPTKSGKMSQIMMDLQGKDYSSIYFFDDILLNHKIVNRIVSARYPNCNYHSLCPKGELLGLNQLIEEHINQKERNYSK